MKALLIKDWKLMKNQKQFFGVIGILVLFFLVIYDNPAFVVSYAVIMFTSFTISTVSYDDYENGMAYLLTLPVNRTKYVCEKYLFGVLTAGIAGTVIIALAAILSVVKGSGMEIEEILVAEMSAFLIAFVFLAFTIPVQLKFGGDKSRMAIMAVMLVIFIIVFGGVALLKATGRSADELFAKLDTLPIEVVVCAILGISVIVMAVSLALSVKFLKEREF